MEHVDPPTSSGSTGGHHPGWTCPEKRLGGSNLVASCPDTWTTSLAALLSASLQISEVKAGQPLEEPRLHLQISGQQASLYFPSSLKQSDTVASLLFLKGLVLCTSSGPSRQCFPTMHLKRPAPIWSFVRRCICHGFTPMRRQEITVIKQISLERLGYPMIVQFRVLCLNGLGFET